MDPEENKIDADIAKGKEDILRARKAKQQMPIDDVSKARSPQEPSELMRAVVDANKRKHTQRDKSNVPSFDVAEKIMAKQRRTTSARRAAPDKIPIVEIPPKSKSTPPMTSPRVDIIPRTRPNSNSMIAEIVTRDIKAFLQNTWDSDLKTGV